MAIQSKTSTGLNVTLTGEEDYGQPTVKVEFRHPVMGDLMFRSSSFAREKNVEGIAGHVAGKRACVTVPRTDFDAAMAEARAIGEKETAELLSGVRKITLHYHDGEYLSGHAVHGRAAKLLIALGIAKDVDGWGTIVDSKAVDALGEEFSYPDAAEYARPAIEEKAAKERARIDAATSRRETAFAEARASGKPVEIRRWSEGCDGSADECDLDIVVQVANPDGTFGEDRIHTH